MAPIMLGSGENPQISHWSLQDGYDDDFSERAYPIRVFNARQDAGLVIFLQVFERDLEFLCRGPIQGFKIILTTPGDMLKMSRHTFRVPLLEQGEISIKPRLVRTSEELRKYSPNQRQCFFDFERRLRFFKCYAQHNCEAECLSNFTVKQCGCVKFSSPSKSVVIIFQSGINRN